MESLQQRLLAKRRDAPTEPIELPVPGWRDECLVAYFRPIDDWAEARDFMVERNAEKEVEMAARCLATYCVKTVGRDSDEVTELPPLGRDLAVSFEMDVDHPGSNGASAARAEDWEGVLAVIPTQTQLMALYTALRAASEGVDVEVSQEILGEYPAS